MAVPFIPIVPHTTNTKIINKTIVYSDTILPLNNIGTNLKISTISNVDESSLEQCLKMIFESNANVLFNTIQYSKNDKKIYFYADKEISSKAWEERNIRRQTPLNDADALIQELVRVLNDKQEEPENCPPLSKNDSVISLYEVACFMKKYNESYEKILDGHKRLLERRMKQAFPDCFFVVHNFEHKKSKFTIAFKRYFSMYGENSNKCDNITFAQQQNGDVYISESDSAYASEIFQVIGQELLALFADMHKFNDFKNQYSFWKKTVNTNFEVNISCHGVEIFSRAPKFNLSSYSYKEGYTYDCNSAKVLEIYKGKEEELFKKVYVRIDDCPEWCQDLLRNIRQEGLEEKEAEAKRIQQEQEKERLKREERLARKEKRKVLIKKVFPFWYESK